MSQGSRPSSRSSLRPASAEANFVAAPPARPPSRGSSSVIRRVHGVEFIADKSWQHTSSRSPRDDEEESNEESSRSKFRAEDGLILQSIVGGAVDPKGLGEGEGDVSSAVTSPVNDVLGPRLVKSVDEFSRSLELSTNNWSELNMLMQAMLKERSDLLKTISRLEEDLGQMSEQRAREQERHKQELEEALRMAADASEASLAQAHANWQTELQEKLSNLRAEDERDKEAALADLASQADQDKQEALEIARQTAEQELMEALSVARQRAEEEKLEALTVLRQSALQEQQEAMDELRRVHQLQVQEAVNEALAKADVLREKAITQEREKLHQGLKKTISLERERMQQEKYRALAEEREKAKLALARVEALDKERKRNEEMKLAIEKAASIEKAVCANCSQEFILQDNNVGSCKCMFNANSVAQVHVEGYLWHAGAELTNWVKLRRRWSCCPQNEVFGTYEDLKKIGCRAHVAL
mmetsp:Transcript_34531/g.77869  ORF Transcript_34531/g.77869 Transcript_34531/m.77869 type:complete len:471 (-) Transcript_34531:122-1534(-)